MFTKINDIEKLPRIVYKGTDIFKLSMCVTNLNNLCLLYEKRTSDGWYNILCGVIVDKKKQNIDKSVDYVGLAITLEEAVNMLYEYISNNPEIKTKLKKN